MEIEIILLPKDLSEDSPVLDQLAELERTCFAADAWSKNMILSSIRQTCTYVWIVQDMQLRKIVAYAVLYLAGDEGDVANIAVLSSYRKRGIGGALFDAMLNQARDEQVQTIYLEVRQSNDAAIRLYRSREFAEIGRRKNYYRHPREDAICMAKTVLQS